ncbi:RNA polymerase sigma (SigV) subunit [Paenibacillus taihuensis]|uniref:RNA polymerase sigma (SigV) subunit n=1 Tax=Paenibacillus taihuensis TaxID=1156355 RepID=A0A3D9RR51_9BACL|nr:RNA polymerase sigma factor [Paenibacillus taihuensis]REE78571.1 RNA polymerase sigma (SigV) subunit [Paenibacillus taihuensis]
MFASHSSKEVLQCILLHKDNAYRLAYTYVRNPDDALDIIQEAIQKALAASKSLKDVTQSKSWFYRIVINTALDFLRKQKNVVTLDVETLETFGLSSQDAYKDFDLESAMSLLPPLYRSVVVLRYFEDMKIEEIAQVLNENVNTIKSRLYEALRKLRLFMNDENLNKVDGNG